MAEYSQLWVGKIKDNSLVVYDPELQPAPDLREPGEVYVYLVDKNRARAFDPAWLKSVLVRPVGREEAHALSEYALWKALDAGAFRRSMEKINKGHLDRAEEDRRRLEGKKERLLERHRLYLSTIGKPFIGIAALGEKELRGTHCYVCTSSLRSDFHVACRACGWLICECGACGCGYKRT